MQVVFHIVARPSLRESLREIVIADIQRWPDYLLQIESEKRVGRRGGWAKIKGDGIPGVINITWHASSRTLVARAITRNDNSPGDLIGRFLGYLLHRRRRDVRAITIHTS